jgi:glycerophosphoryl diester phosphodiesterase
MITRIPVLASLALATVMTVNRPAPAADAPNPSSATTRPVEIVAHRGESYDAPENTLAAFNLAWERGGQAVETDVHLTADGKLIISHDKDTFRTTGGPRHGGQKLVILEHTADELRKLDVGRWKAPVWAGQRLPLVDELLATLPKQTNRRLFIEVKVGPEAAAPLIAAINSAGHPLEQTAVISFNLQSCAEVKRQMPELQVYFLHGMKPDKKAGKPAPAIDELIKMAKDAKLDGLDLAYDGAPLDAAGIKKIHDAGLKCYIWTVDEIPVAKKFIEAGVDGITTNRAAWMREQLGLPDFGK